MVATLTAVIGVASASLWLAILYVVGSVWLRSRRDPESFEINAEDGCGCVEMWEHLSERRSED